MARILKVSAYSKAIRVFAGFHLFAFSKALAAS